MTNITSTNTFPPSRIATGNTVRRPLAEHGITRTDLLKPTENKDVRRPFADSSIARPDVSIARNAEISSARTTHSAGSTTATATPTHSLNDDGAGYVNGVYRPKVAEFIAQQAAAASPGLVATVGNTSETVDIQA